MKTILHLLRAVLVGGLVLFVIGVVVAAGERPQSAAPPDAAAAPAAPDAGDAGPAVPPLRFAFQTAFAGALVALVTTLLLSLFPVGPTTKIVYGAVFGPVLPMLAWAPQTLREGRPDDVGGLLLLGILTGLLVGLLEANRVIQDRRKAREAAPL